MARPLIPFVQNGYYASRNWIPLVKGNGFTTSGGGEQEEVWETASGSVVTFDAIAAPLRRLSVAVEPVQNLNGYDSPWPAGGGANKMVPLVAGTYETNGITVTVSEDGYVHITGQKTVSTGNTVSIPIQGTGYVKAGQYMHMRNDYVLGSIVFTYGASPTIGQLNRIWQYTSDATVTGASVYMTADVTDTLDITLRPSVEDTNAVTDWTPYENECPISGWSSLTVEQRGVNMWDEEWENARINLTTGAVASGNGLLSKNLIPVKPNTQYHAVSGSYAGGTSFLFAYYDADGSYLNYEVKFGMSVNFTTPANARFIRFNIQTSDAVTYNHDASINYPATDTSYQPYNPLSRSISISLGETVYSGTLDVLTGVVTVTWFAVDMGSISWAKSTDGRSIFYGSAAAGTGKSPKGWSNALTPNAICSCYEGKQYQQVQGQVDGFNIATTTKYIYLYSESQKELTADQLKTAVTGQTLCYELATPIPIQLTPQEVSTLQGVNNVWSDAGDVTVEYRAR